MAWFWWLLWIFIVVIWIVSLVDIIRRRHERTAGKTIAWILFIIILPVLGSIVYFAINGVGGEPEFPQREGDTTRLAGGR
ncbi:MAG TPA: PLDc N-terminal domain-containing protein [Gaiellaceae bacterium]